MTNATKKAPRVDAILAGAARAFAENGFAATTMRQIAGSSGSSLGGIYHHFDSKERILQELIAGNFRRVLAALEERLEGVDEPRAAFEIFVDNHVAFFVRHLDQMRVMAHELDTLTGSAGEEVAELRRAYTEKAQSILHALRPELSKEDLRVDALCLFGMLIWTYRWFQSLEDGANVRQLADRMSSLYLQGFLHRDGEGA